jgi:hypothetical protein
MVASYRFRCRARSYLLGAAVGRDNTDALLAQASLI